MIKFRRAALVVPLSFLIVLTISIVVAPLSSAATSPLVGTDTSAVDYWPTTGWLNAIPEKHGMDSSKLNEMMEFIEMNEWNYDSIVIIRNGYIVFETYPGVRYDDNERHILYSVTKSVTSVLIGIAIQEGFIESVNQTMVSFFPNRTIANLDADKESITIENLLLMNTGLEWDEWSTDYGTSNNSITLMFNSADPIQHYLDLPMEYNPGEQWVYNSGGSHMLGAILRQMTGMTVLQFAIQYLFSPLNITDVWWSADPLGNNHCGGGLQMTPQDLAKIGFLYQNNGTWDGQEIVSPSWIENSTRTMLYQWENYEYQGYGYQWWTLPTLDIYNAAGLEGQNLYIDNEHDLIVAMTASHPRYHAHPNDQILYQYILASIGNTESSTGVFEDYLTLSLLVVLPLPIVLTAFLWFLKTKKFKEVI
ncbi:MAG: serine hydrolase domain-containing protein [Candidatus Thorarchaeota archaeon]